MTSTLHHMQPGSATQPVSTGQATTANNVERVASPSFWVRLGSDISDATSLSEAMQLGGLDWTVSVHPASEMKATKVYNAGTESETREVIDTSIPGRWLVVHDSTNVTLSLVGSVYKPYQNATVFAPGEFLSQRGASFVAGGAFNHGRTTFMVMKPAGGDVTVTTPTGVDTIRVDVMMSTSHDGTQLMQHEMRATRVYRNTTTTMSLPNIPGLQPVMTAKHTNSGEGALQEAEKMLRKHASYVDAFAGVVQRLADTPVSASQFRSLAEDVLPMPATAATALRTLSEAELPQSTRTALDRWRTKVTSLVAKFAEDETAPNTAYGAYIVLADYSEHDKPTRASKGTTREHAKAVRSYYDQARSFRNKVASRLLGLANHA